MQTLNKSKIMVLKLDEEEGESGNVCWSILFVIYFEIVIRLNCNTC